MIEWVEITNYIGEKLRITLTEAEPAHGLIIKSIDGLGPPQGVINTTPIVTMDGDMFNSSRLEKRNIVMDLLFTFADLIEDSRLRTYKFFAIKRELRFEIKTDRRQAYIYGYVESNEPNIFSEQEEAQISIICPYPYFTACGPGGSVQESKFFGSEPMFEFIYENDRLNEKRTEFGQIFDDLQFRQIEYAGDVDVGIRVEIYTLDTWDYIRIFNADTRESMMIDATRITNMVGLSRITAGDRIILNTNPGSKSLKLIRNGREYNIFNALEKGCDWLKFRKGVNNIALQTNNEFDKIQLTISADILYEGV